MGEQENAPIYRSAEGERLVMQWYDQLLEGWPVAREELHLPTRYGDTFVIASGDPAAEPVLLLHGSSSNALAWGGDVAELSRAFRVYAVDLPGEPGRSSHTRPSWEGPAFGEWLEDVLGCLGVARISLVGISQGGWTALKFATRRPERVARLVLLAPGGISNARASFLLRAIPLTFFGRRGAEATNRIVFGRQPIHPDVVAFMNLIMTHFRPRIGAQRLFTNEELQRLDMPVLLIAGAQDALYPSAQTAARLSRLLPHLTTVLLPEAGHVLVGLAPRMVPFLRGTAQPVGEPASQ
jgi:pimeloyl-ACP methyl ester carboxylesterase